MRTSQVGRFLRTPFGLAVVGLLVLAGWAFWTAGIADNELQRAARSGSVYAAHGAVLNPADTAVAAEIIGNRRLFVAFLDADADLSAACGQTAGPAAGTLVLLLSHNDDSDRYRSYGCSQLPGEGAENFGKAFVAEALIRQGINVFHDRPLEALKVIVVNYDMLAKANTVPDQARTISPSLPRYLIAIAAVAAVLAGSGLAYLGSRRAGKLAALRAQNRDEASDSRSSLKAKSAILARHIIELDRRYERDPQAKRFGTQYRGIVADYTTLVEELADSSSSFEDLETRVDDLLAQCRALKTGM